MRFEPDRRDAQLATAMQLTEAQVDLVWAVMARAVDPHLLALLQPVYGNDIRRGLSIAHYATVMGLGDDEAAELADVVLPGHPLRRHKFLIAAEDSHVDVCTPLTVPPRVWSYLRGDDDLEEGLAASGGRIHVPHEPTLDDSQRVALQRIAGGLGALERTVVVIEEPVGAGRRTAVALAASATERPVIAVDVTRIAPGQLDATLASLMRVCLPTRSR
jgi:hypothetical protein